MCAVNAPHDRFARHPKLEGLTVEQKWAWLMVLLWCSEYETGGAVPAEFGSTSIPGADRKFMAICREKRLLDELDDGSLRVHDWDFYNGRALTAGERQKAWRERRNRNARVDEDVDGRVDETVTRGRRSSRAIAGTRSRSPLGERESDRATLSLSKDEQAKHEEGDDAVASTGSTTSSPSSPVLTGRPAEPRSATNLDTGTIADGTLDWCLGDCGKKYDLDELGAEGMCSSCRAKQKEES